MRDDCPVPKSSHVWIRTSKQVTTQPLLAAFHAPLLIADNALPPRCPSCRLRQQHEQFPSFSHSSVRPYPADWIASFHLSKDWQAGQNQPGSGDIRPQQRWGAFQPCHVLEVSHLF